MNPETSSDSEPASAFVTGGTGFLGSHFLAAALQHYRRTWCLVRGDDPSQARARLGARLQSLGLEPGERIGVVLGDVESDGAALGGEDLESLRRDQVRDFWHFAATLEYEPGKREKILRRNLGGAGNMVRLAVRMGARRFVYISTAFVAGKREGLIPEAPLDPAGMEFNNAYEESKCLAEQEVLRLGRECGIDVRILRPPIVVGPASDHSTGGSTTGFYGFATILSRWREVLANAPRGLRIRGDLDTPVHLTPVDSFVADARYLLQHGFPGGPVYHCVAPTELQARHLSGLFGRALDIPPLELGPGPIENPSLVEKLVERMMALYGVAVRYPKRFQRSLPAGPPMTPRAAERFLEEWKREQGGAQQAAYRKASIHSFDGTQMDVYVAGDSSAKTTIVLVNAFGMDVAFMLPLLTQLSRSARVITWDSRGLPDAERPFPEEACDITAHARDLEAILDHFQVDTATLAGWCTGAQVALRFAAIAPRRVRRIVSVHGAFSLPESVEVTAFKRNIMYLMPRIARGREHARAYHEMLYGNAKGGTAAGADAIDDEGRATETLLSSDELLTNMTSAPFRTPETLYRYAKLVMHLTREPEHAWAPFVECPVLVMSGLRDSVAHPEESRAVARQLRESVLVMDETADHFGMYHERRYADAILAFDQQGSLS